MHLGGSGYYANRFEKVEAKPEPEESEIRNAPFQVGDKVKALDSQGAMQAGNVYTVGKLDKQPNSDWLVYPAELHGPGYFAYRFQKLVNAHALSLRQVLAAER